MSQKKDKDTSKNNEQPTEAPETKETLDDATTETGNATCGETETMIQKIQELTEKLEKEKNDYLFLRADFDNYRKRMLKEREELLRNAGEKVLKNLLPIVDDFERGLQAAESTEGATAVHEGMKLIYSKLLRFLADNGVTPMESTGQPFDPDFHEAIATIPAPSDDLKGKVIDTTTRGYMINDKVLRHAKVAVGE